MTWRGGYGAPALPRPPASTRAENAMTIVMALGGSTNAVLHLLAIAHTVGVPLEIDDFQVRAAPPLALRSSWAIRRPPAALLPLLQRASDRTPLLANLKPSGKFVMEDMQAVGGTPAVLKYLLRQVGCRAPRADLAPSIAPHHVPSLSRRASWTATR